MACPICGADTQAQMRPFCSKRCADLDLAKWLGGAYATPSVSDDPDAVMDALERHAAAKNDSD